MRGSIEPLRLASQVLELAMRERLQFMHHLGIVLDDQEAAALIEALRRGGKLESEHPAPHRHFTIETLETLARLVAVAEDEKERALLSLLYNGAFSQETAVLARGVNGVLPSAFSSKNIRTPLGRLIESKDIEQIPGHSENAHPFYFLTPKGLKLASLLAERLIEKAIT